MFKLDQSPTIRWPVEFVASKDGGGDERFSFVAVFLRRGIEYITAQQAQIDAGELTYQQLVTAELAGWDDVYFGDEKAQFTPDNLRTLMDYPGMPRAIFRAYMQCCLEAAAKN